MKTPIALSLLLLSIAMPLLAQEPADKNAATHNELRAFRDGLIDAMNKGDIEKQLEFFHPNTVVTWHNAEVSRGRDGVRAYLQRMLQGPNRVVESYHADVKVDELTILYGETVGIAFGSAIETIKLAGGRSVDLPARWSATLVKDNGKWLIADLHASDNLFDNPPLTMAKRMVFWVGGLGLLVGLAGGFLLGRSRRRA